MFVGMIMVSALTASTLIEERISYAFWLYPLMTNSFTLTVYFLLITQDTVHRSVLDKLGLFLVKSLSSIKALCTTIYNAYSIGQSFITRVYRDLKLSAD